MSEYPNEMMGKGLLDLVEIARSSSKINSYAPLTPAGDVNFNVVDRAAITNLVNAYGIAYDTYCADEFFKLFTPDAILVVGYPGQKTIALTGELFYKKIRQRLEDHKKASNQRRRLFNVTFLEETEDTAHCAAIALLMNIQNEQHFTCVTSIVYEGWFKKIDGVWKISRWHDFLDLSPEVAV